MGQKVGVTVEASHRVYTADDAEFDVLRVWIRQKCAHLKVLATSARALHVDAAARAKPLEAFASSITTVGEAEDNLASTAALSSVVRTTDVMRANTALDAMMMSEDVAELQCGVREQRDE